MKATFKFIAKVLIATAITFAAACINIAVVNAQNVTKQGTTFVVGKEKTNAKEATKSKYTIQIEGKKYALYVGPRGGVYYLKDGKKCYNVPAEVKKAVKGA